MGFWQRLLNGLDPDEAEVELDPGPRAQLAVTPIAPGLPGDGLTRIISGGSGGPTDRAWYSVRADALEALAAWRSNPMARRFTSLISAYVVGDGIRLSSENKALQRFIDDFWQHPENRILLRQRDWCDEISRSGEFFPVLFVDPSGGVPWVRAIPATEIDVVEWRRMGQYEDYEAELRYHQMAGEVSSWPDMDGAWWYHPRALKPGEYLTEPLPEEASTMPVMLHFAVNRPVGALRGESDLGPVLLWMRRYSAWLEDRVRLNAAMRAFLWVVHVPAELKAAVASRFQQSPPPPGSVVVAEEGTERWEAVTPNLRATDAKEDGRALRWMIAAGGPGISLIDFGEGEDANQATGNAMKEQRQRFLRQRQAYFAEMLVEITLVAYERWRETTGARARSALRSDIIVTVPDITPDNNAELATAAGSIVSSIKSLADLVGASDDLRATAVRLFAKFGGETITDAQVEQWIAEGAKELEERKQMEQERMAGKQAPGAKKPPPAKKGDL